MAQTTTRNYYKILGITQKTSKADIKKKYRELAKKYHPDTNSGSKVAEDKFKIISEAYEVLSNAKKRKEYDRERAYQKKSPRRPRSQPDWSGPPGGFGRESGGNQQRQEEPFAQEPEAVDPDMPTSGFDLQFMIDVPLPIVALGGTIPYTYEKYVQCEECEGTGSSGGDECPECQGKQLVVRSVTLDVKIPPGVADQYTLAFIKEGGAGRNGGPPGQLFLKICTQPHPKFKRVKNDIIEEVFISASLAEEGGPLKVDTLNGTTTIQVEEETLVGEELRVPGEGAAISWGKKRGDLIIKFNIEAE
ncbi:MAG: J domain-containing protein [Nitrospina sp.]|jgi:molecular chaperone DnaJ|nr:J domain-containing protein [Nitrospina sp.]MBT3508185.1 J domain-containing protein [Nitrospina sp.]MBT3874836.1 J domain-containing protein [Nitrospina sp.]MBT4048002.1 J domain-containing protein [Nitrospina sp.]MBT4555961.1 J domain-containing protein [Nitrospina sp.]